MEHFEILKKSYILIFRNAHTLTHTYTHLPICLSTIQCLQIHDESLAQWMLDWEFLTQVNVKTFQMWMKISMLTSYDGGMVNIK